MMPHTSTCDRNHYPDDACDNVTQGEQEMVTICRGGPTADCGDREWHESHRIGGPYLDPRAQRGGDNAATFESLDHRSRYLHDRPDGAEIRYADDGWQSWNVRAGNGRRASFYTFDAALSWLRLNDEADAYTARETAARSPFVARALAGELPAKEIAR